MQERLKDGTTYRANLEVAARMGSVAARAELAGPGLPIEAGYLWGWFVELNAGRSSNGFAANPISWAEIDAWARRTGTDPLPWEVRWIKVLDATWMREPEKAKA